MRGNIVHGAGFLISGMKLIFSPGLKRFTLIPVVVNAIIFVAIILFAAVKLWIYFNGLTADFPIWAVYSIGILLFFVYILASILITTTLFVFVTNIIASPFYGILAEKVELLITSRQKNQLTSWGGMLMIAPRTIAREIRKLFAFLPWFLLGGFLFFFPLLLPLAPIAWFLIMAWILAIQYVDYTADNQGKNFSDTIKLLKQEPITVIGFGLITSFLITIPILNLLVPPAAVAGGCKLWLHLQPRQDLG